jgi:hypothetical protein
MQRRHTVSILLCTSLLRAPGALSQGDIIPIEPEKTEPIPDSQRRLVEEFTAETLEQGEFKIGTDAEYGVTRRLMIGTDLITSALGAPTLQGKYRVWEQGPHSIALGFRAANLTKETLLWGHAGEYYDRLSARMVRPQISWSRQLSPRLTLHTFWSKGLGKIKAKLSEKGRRDLWEAKHPGSSYDERDTLTQEPSSPAASSAAEGETTSNQTTNRERAASERSSLTTRTTQVQSITGLAQERFQITGEFVRDDGNKILVTSRIEQTELEQLRSSAFRMTVAHQWIWTSFQMRLGVGAQYYSLSGRDLDGEITDDAGLAPASDISVYWRF